MHQDKPEEIVIITSQDGIWREEKISLAVPEEGPPDPRAKTPGVERSWSPFQWKRMFKEKTSPGYEKAMDALRMADTNIARWADELNYLTNFLPKDPTKLPDIALILIEIQQRLDSITEAARQVKPAKDKKLQDFYGRFHVQIPENLRTPGKIATAGFMGDFVRFLGRKIFEYTDSDIREMKRVVTHLLNTTRQTVKSVNKTLKDMRSARKAGDIDKYIEGAKFISKEQGDFKREFSVVYDSYLKEPYQHAYELEQEEKAKAEAEGRKFEKPFEEVVFEPDGAKIIEVDSPPPGEAEPLEVAEDAERYDKSQFGEVDPNIDVFAPQTDRTPRDSELVPTRRVNMEEVQLTDPDLAPRTVPDAPPTELEAAPPTEVDEPAPPTARSRELPPIVGPPPSSSEMELSPSQPIPKPKPAPVLLPDGTWSDAPKPEPVGRLRIEEPFLEGIGSQLQEAMTKVSHARFLAKLGKIAETENKYVVAAFMAKYSEELEDVNPQASAAILKAAQEISK